MSANEHPDTVFECIRAGAEDYLLKPLTKKEVQYIWQHVWRRKHQPALRVSPQPVQEQVRLSFIMCRHTHHVIVPAKFCHLEQFCEGFPCDADMLSQTPTQWILLNCNY